MAVLVALALLVVTLYLSTLALALRGYSRTRIEEMLSADLAEKRLAWLDGHAEDAQRAVWLLRAAANLLLLVAVFMAFQSITGAPANLSGFTAPLLITLALLMVFSIAIPHAVAAIEGESVLARSFPFVSALNTIAMPILVILRGLEAAVRWSLGRKKESPEEATERVEQDILDAVSEGEAQGAVDEQQKELITSVIELGDTKVSAIMTPRARIDGVPLTASFESIRNLVLATGHSRVPVYEESIDHIVGVIYAKDLLRVRNPETFQVRRWMRIAPYVPETKSVDDLLEEFRASRVQIAIVLDEYGATAGIATIEDILEELVGEIDDEYDQTSRIAIQRLDQDTVEVDGRVSVWDVNEQLGLELPIEPGYETIGGFLSTAMGRIPASGEEFKHDNVRFRVLDAEPRKINRLQITLPREPQAVT